MADKWTIKEVFQALPYVAANTGRDVAVSLGRGGVNLGESVVGIADLFSGGAAGRGLRGIGYNPEKWREGLARHYSDAQKAAMRNVDEAQGAWGKTRAAFANPAALGNAMVEAVPVMLGGTTAGVKMAAPLLSKTGMVAKRALPKAAAFLGEGGVNATGTAGRLAQDRADAGAAWNIRDAATDTAKAIGAGLVGGAVGRVGAGLTGRVTGLPDVDNLAYNAAGNARRRILLPGESTPNNRMIMGGGVAGGAISEAGPENAMQGNFTAAMNRFDSPSPAANIAQAPPGGGNFGGAGANGTAARKRDEKERQYAINAGMLGR